MSHVADRFKCNVTRIGVRCIVRQGNAKVPGYKTVSYDEIKVLKYDGFYEAIR